MMASLWAIIIIFGALCLEKIAIKKYSATAG
jgi:hypothetical protein